MVALPKRQDTNILTRLDASNDCTTLTVKISTCRPSMPELALWCCDPRPVLKRVKRTGLWVPHGKKQFLPCTPQYYSPSSGAGHDWQFSVPASDPQTQCKDCHFAIIQREAQPKVTWTSQLHPCPMCVEPPPILGSGEVDGGSSLVVTGPIAQAPFKNYNTVSSSPAVQSSGTALSVLQGGSFVITLHGAAYAEIFNDIQEEFTFRVVCMEFAPGSGTIFQTPAIRVNTPLVPTQFWGPFVSPPISRSGITVIQHQLEVLSLDSPTPFAIGGVGAQFVIDAYA